MSEEAGGGEAPIVESKAAPEVQAKAEKLGWIPPKRFKGNPERFVDADTYIERGETVLPIVKEHNRRLEAELGTLKTQAAQTAAALKSAQEALEQIEERHVVERQKAVEQARADLRKQLAAASEAGDHEAVADITEQMTQLREEPPKAAPKKNGTDTIQPFVPPAELVAWQQENQWFGQDKRKTALAMGIAQELRDGGETAVGRAFFDKVSEELEKTMPTQRQARGDKVEGARNSSEGTRGGKKSYASLPAEARAACDADLRQFVGKDKRYKTADEWRSRYAELYFQSEQQ